MHPRMNQDAKKVGKNKEEKMKEVAHIKCHSCDELGHLASGCSNKLEKEAQACQVLQVPHMGSPYLYVPNQEIGEARSGASTKATS